MKIVVRNAEDNCYIADTDNYTPMRDQARDFPSITEAHRYCRERGLRKHVLLVVSDRLIVSEMQIGEC